MLGRYIGKDTKAVEGSPSSSKPSLEDQVRSPFPPPAFDGLKEVEVDIQQGVQSTVQSTTEVPPLPEKLSIDAKGGEPHPTAVADSGEKQIASADIAAFKVHPRQKKLCPQMW
jgi:hypothetical protein